MHLTIKKTGRTSQLLLVCLTLLSIFSCSNGHDAKYADLDAAVAHRSDDLASKQKNLSVLQGQLKSCTTNEARFQIYNELFNEYLAFKADSAVKYVNILCNLAEEINIPEYKNQAYINKSAILATSGLFNQAEAVLQQLDKSTFTTANYRLYYENCRWLYITWGAYIHNDEIAVHYQDKVHAYSDSMLTVIPRGDVDYYYWKGESHWGKREYAKAEEQYRLGIERMSPLSRRYASITCSMALVAREQENWDDFEKFMILAAIADQKIPLKENMAMQELALFLTTRCDDTQRGNEYILCSLEDAVFYGNRLRLMEIAKKFPDIVVKYQENNGKVQTMQTIIIVVATIFIIVLLLLAWYSVRSNRDLKAQRKIRIKLIGDLTAANENLNTLSKDLKETNMQLKETNTLRERYVSLFIELCAAYIDKYNKFHKTIERKVKAHQVDDMLTLLHQNRTKDVDAREFFMNFDKAFLSLYPNFIHDFNQLLKSEQQVTLKNGEIMSNELRIMALMRLGVTDTQKISTLLFYSPQTIYNYRSVFKQKALDPENFESNIMQCG